MKCDEAKERWHLQLETGVKDAALNEHFQSCPICCAFSEEMTSVIDQLGTLRQVTEHLGSAAHSPGSEHVAVKRRPWAGTLVRMAALVGLVAAAGIYYASVGDTANRPDRPETLEHLQPAMATADQYEGLGLSLRGDSAKRYLAVAQSSSNSTVHIYTLYRTFDKEVPLGPAS